VTFKKTVEARFQGGMGFTTTTGSGHTIVADDSDGNTGSRPTELLMAALVACTGMDVVSILAKKRQVVSEYAVHSRSEQRRQYPQVFTTIEVVHDLVGPDLDVRAVRRAIELSARKYCPVSAMLSAGETTIHHRYRVRRTGSSPLDESGEVCVTGPYERPEVAVS
jgi:putative redox protein